jgi:RNA polymerase-interacting CarD/CdnL/TRCF family regulator
LWYWNVGVVSLVDIRRESVGDMALEYYVLSDLSSKTDSRIFVPTNNKKLCANMRRLLTESEARALVDGICDILPMPFTKENKKRADEYKKVIDTGDHRKMIAMIKAIIKNGEVRELEGKKNFIADENLMNKALQLMATELSVVLLIEKDAALEMIREKLFG